MECTSVRWNYALIYPYYRTENSSLLWCILIFPSEILSSYVMLARQEVRL